MEEKEAYEILGISPDQKENAKKAYLRLSKEKHPDKGGDPDEFLKINEAYKTLVEVKKPEDYREERLELKVGVSLEEAVFGVIVETHIKPQSVSSFMISEGKATSYIEVMTITEKIPPLSLLQKPIVKVYPKKLIGGKARDISVSYSLKEHERYRICSDRSKALLSVDQQIPVMTAIQGGIVEVETMFGVRKLNVRAGTNIGDSYVIKNHGLLGGLEVVVSGFQMPVVVDSSENEVEQKRQKEVDEEDSELEKNRKDAERIQGQSS